MNKKGITHIEAVMAIAIFLAGIVIVFMLAQPVFMAKQPTSIQLSGLEKAFKEAGKEVFSFYVTGGNEDKECLEGYEQVIIQNPDPPFLIYTDKSSIVTIIASCNLEGKYSFPYKETVYDLAKLNELNINYNGNYHIQIGENKNNYVGKPLPSKVSVDSKEIDIKILDSNVKTIDEDGKAILYVW